MTRSRVRLACALLAAVLLGAAPLGAAGQSIQISINEFSNPAVRILQDYALKEGETAQHVVVVGGDAKIDGKVDEDVVVILGKVELGRTAAIDGNFVAVASTVDIASGAKVGRDFVVIGDSNTPAAFTPGGQYVVIGTAGLGDGLRSMVPWVTHGLLLGRPIVPWLGWVWITAAVFFFINLCLNMLFDSPIRAAATTLRATPFSAFMAGLLVLLLAGPVCLLLMVSVIGIAVVPFVLVAIIAAGLLGRVAFARWIGMTVVAQADPADRSESLRSFAIGSGLMCVAYMIPVIGFIVWILAGVFGLGAATLAFHAAYRRENPKPPKKVKGEPPTPPPPVVPPQDTSGGSGFHDGDADRIEPAAAAAVELPPAAVAPPPQGGTYLPSARELVAYPKAEFAERLGGFALDAVAIAIVAQLLGFDHNGAPFERMTLILALVYHVGFWTWKGTTPGGMICQLRVVRTDGRPLEFVESLVRGLTGIISLTVAGLGFLWILRDPERQAWHDRVAGTYVVKVPRAYPI